MNSKQLRFHGAHPSVRTINGADETHPYHFCKIAQNGSRKSGLKSLEVRQKSKGVKRHAVKGQNVMLHMLYDIGAMGLLGHKLSSNSREAKNFGASTMRTNLPKLLDLLIFCLYSLNFNLEFSIMMFFVMNQLIIKSLHY